MGPTPEKLHRRGRRATPSPRGDRGMTAVFFAVIITGLLAVVSLVLGASTGYSSVRDGQNAADAAALAATSTLRDVGLGRANASEVLSTAVSVAEDNGADGGSVLCDVVTARYAISYDELQVIGPCNGTNELASDAAGVRVRLEDTGDVPFGGAIDQTAITARAVASATAQPLRGDFGAPFMLCAGAGDHGVELLLPNATVTPPYTVNPAALGVEFLLWSNGNGFGDRNCGSSQWHGLVNSDNSYQVPSNPHDNTNWWDIDPGSTTGHISPILAGSNNCGWAENIDLSKANPVEPGCRLPLPLCVSVAGSGTNARFNCVRMAVFELTYVGDGQGAGSCVSDNKKVVCGVLLPGGIATGGQGTLETPDPSELVAINLVQ